MARGIVVDGYYVEWLPDEKKIVITPQKPSSNKVSFGLGNAVITIDIANIPKKLISKITEDPDIDVQKMAVPIDYGQARLMQPARNIKNGNIVVRLSGGGSKRLRFVGGDIRQFRWKPVSGKLSGTAVLYNFAYSSYGRILW